MAPSLNGGLFREEKIEGVEEREIKIEGTKELILDILNKYNWIIGEESPEEEDVIGDLTPEIIGHIYEKFVVSLEQIKIENIDFDDIQTVKGELKLGRKKIGAYYTPEEITNYISMNTLYPCITDRINERFKKRYKNIWKGLLYKGRLTEEEAEIVKFLYFKVLTKLRICDNACGSGSFLIAAGKVLLPLYSRVIKLLKDYRSDDEEVKEVLEDIIRSPSRNYYIVRQIITNNLYGVDIMEGAVEIAKLRFWLWLISQVAPKEAEGKEIETLPNLDYNLMAGNSLIGFVDIEEQKTLLSSWLEESEEEWLKNLAKEKQKFKTLSTRDAGRLKAKLDEEIGKARRFLDKKFFEMLKAKGIEMPCKDYEEFAEDLKPFHWGFEFYDAFDLDTPKEERGFDVVMGNPPYVRQEKISDSKPLLSPYYSCYSGIADLYVYFYERGISTIKEKGFLGYISSNKWMKVEYGRKMRMFMKNMTIKSIIDFYELPVFDVSTEPAIVILKKQKSQEDIKYLLLDDLPQTDLSNLFKSESMRFGKKYLDDSGWNFSDEKAVKIIEQMYDDSTSLKEYTNNKLFYGIKTGLNAAFIIDEKTKDELIKKDPKSAEIINPYLRGTDIHRYYLKFDNLYFLATGYDLDIPTEYPAVYKHLLNFKDRLEKRCDKGVNWYNLRACAYYQEFDKPKIVYIHTAVEHGFYLDTEGYYLNNSSYFISVDDKYLLCFLNSSLFKFYKINTFVAFGDAKGRGRCKLDYNKMQKVPIQKVQKSQKGVFKNLADYMLFLNTTEERRKSEKELIEFIDKQVIDSLVYELYFKEKFEEDGLKTNLLGLVEPYLKGIEGLKTEEEKLEVIEDVVEEIKKDGRVMKEIEKIRSHEWVKVIEGER